MQEHILHLDSVSAGYGRNPVVQNINFSLNQGECFGLAGLNGSGKTTLIKSIIGLRKPQSGRVFISGKENITFRNRKNFVYLPEKFSPPWFLTGIEFLEFSLRLYGQSMNRGDFFQHAERFALDPDALLRRVQTYSKGMQQKLGLLSALLVNTPLCILDEPMSGLDPAARACVKGAIKDKVDQNSAIFLSSHILSDMDEMCDRIGVLHDSMIKFTGYPQALKEQTGTTTLEKAFLHFIQNSQSL